MSCRWCRAVWWTENPAELAHHEAQCAFRVECPDCGAAIGWTCTYPGGKRIRPERHVARQRLAALASQFDGFIKEAWALQDDAP